MSFCHRLCIEFQEAPGGRKMVDRALKFLAIMDSPVAERDKKLRLNASQPVLESSAEKRERKLGLDASEILPYVMMSPYDVNVFFATGGCGLGPDKKSWTPTNNPRCWIRPRWG